VISKWKVFTMCTCGDAEDHHYLVGYNLVRHGDRVMMASGIVAGETGGARGRSRSEAELLAIAKNHEEEE